MSDKPSVVIVEDEFLIASYLETLCGKLGVEVCAMAATMEDAVAAIMDHKPAYVLMDVRLQGRRDGVDAAKTVHDELPDTKIIFITGSNEPPTIARIEEDHPFKILIKPIARDDLAAAFGLAG